MKIYNSQNGFTLIEVMIAIALLTIGILGAAAMQISSIGGNNLASRLTSAANWASDTHETLMALPYTVAVTDPLLLDNNANGFAGLDNTVADPTAIPPIPQADGGPLSQGDYTIFWNVADDYPIVNCKTIRVLVRRNDKGIIKTVSQNFTKMRAI